MDFNSTPDFGDLPVPSTSQTTPSFPPPEFDPPSEPVDPVAAGTSSSPAKNEKKQFIYTLVIALFITLVIGVICLFAVYSYLKQNDAKKTAGKYTFGSGSIVPTAQPTPIQKAKPVAVATISATLAPTGSVNGWTIRLRQQAVTLSELEDIHASTVSASVLAPVAEGDYVCTSSSFGDNQYFTIKKSDKVFERLCDGKKDPQQDRLVCSKYNPATGVQIEQTLYPKTDCTKGTIEAGTYVLYSRVYYECNLDGKPLNDVSPVSCNQNKEVYSTEMRVDE